METFQIKIIGWKLKFSRKGAILAKAIRIGIVPPFSYLVPRTSYLLSPLLLHHPPVIPYILHIFQVKNIKSWGKMVEAYLH